MNLNQAILEHVEKLSPEMQSEVLDFVLYLEQKAQRERLTAQGEADPLAIFEQYRGRFDGRFDRDELYDR